MVTKQKLQQLQDTACALRHHIVDMIGCQDGKVGHLGGSCSATDVVTCLYFYKMNLNPKNLQDPARSRFLLSKGHAALVQYAALAELGIIPKEELKNVKKRGSMLQGHPDRSKTPGIEANTGSLGQGLSIGLGLALGMRLDGIAEKVYVMMGDGEQAEGQIWEAAIAAAAYGMDNLVAILDHNKVQAMGTVEERLRLGCLAEKWRAFGWHVIEVDGHDLQQVCDALDEADTIKGKPVILVANTIKGKGVSFAEGKATFHNCGLTPEQFQQAHELIDISAHQ